MADKKPAVTPTAKATDTNKVKNSLTGQALTVLKKRHLTEFEAIATELFAEAGLKRVRRLTQDEKDLAKYLELSKKFGTTPDAGPGDSPTEPHDPAETLGA